MTGSALHPLRLYKREKLCSVASIDMLFARQGGTSAIMAYPLRIVWRLNPGRRRGKGVQFLISVPKKRLRHAVDRVTMRRRIREAYRLCRASCPIVADIDMAIIYVAPSLLPYGRVAAAIEKALARLAASPLLADASSIPDTSADEGSATAPQP